MIAQRVPDANGNPLPDGGPSESLPLHDYSDIEVHPVAALFPMMTDDELDDLAADIKANGLVHPIVLDNNGLLIDGRNRLEGCLRAEAEPRFEELPDGVDPVAFILSCNVNRRHLNKGQQAMAVAKALQVTTKLSLRQMAEKASVNRERVRQAATVLDYAPDLADAVLAGVTPLNEAYAEARHRKEAAETDEAKFARLQEEAPELASMVQEERLTLEGALAELAERYRKAEEKRQKARQYLVLKTESLEDILTALDPGAMDLDKWAEDFLKADARLVGREIDLSPERAERAASVLIRYAALRRENENGKG